MQAVSDTTSYKFTKHFQASKLGTNFFNNYSGQLAFFLHSYIPLWQKKNNNLNLHEVIESH